MLANIINILSLNYSIHNYLIIISHLLNQANYNLLNYSKTKIWENSTSYEIKRLLSYAKEFLEDTNNPKVNDHYYSFSILLLYLENKNLFDNLSEHCFEHAMSFLLDNYDSIKKETYTSILLDIRNTYPNVFLQALLTKAQEQAKRDYCNVFQTLGDLITLDISKKIIDLCLYEDFSDKNRYAILNESLTFNPQYTKDFIEKNIINQGKSLKKFIPEISVLITKAFPEKINDLIDNLTSSRTFANKWLHIIIPEYNYKNFHIHTLFKSASLIKLKQFYIFLIKLLPQKKCPVHEGVYSPKIVDKIYQFKSNILEELIKYPDKGNVLALKEIQSLDPGEKYLSRCINLAKKQQLILSRPVFPLETISSFLSKRNTAILVSSAKELHCYIINLLNEYQIYLTGKKEPRVTDLWNDGNATVTPKIEEDISDHLCSYLNLNLRNTNITVNREVQINRGRNGNRGSRTDLWITATNPSINSTPITLCIEVKRSSNPSAKTALKTQLLDKYMNEGAANAGILLIAWFDSKQTPQDNNQWGNDRKIANIDLSDQAKILQNQGHLISHVIINCDYRK